jgi:diacylglycerol kinase family enzyme
VKAILRNTAQKLTVRLDDTQKLEGEFIGIVVANGASTGGGMKLAPRAVNDDGQLDVLLIYDQPLARQLASFPAIYAGRHIGMPEFGYHRARAVGADRGHIFRKPVAYGSGRRAHRRRPLRDPGRSRGDSSVPAGKAE